MSAELTFRQALARVPALVLSRAIVAVFAWLPQARAHPTDGDYIDYRDYREWVWRGHVLGRVKESEEDVVVRVAASVPAREDGDG